MSDELVKRLRDNDDWHDASDMHAMREAADLIEQQTARIAELETARSTFPQLNRSELTINATKQKAIDRGFKYWRASDAHGVVATNAQAVDLLQDLLGVEVEINVQDKKSDWHPDFVVALYENCNPNKRYTMDQMREYADAFHRSRVDAALSQHTGVKDD